MNTRFLSVWVMIAGALGTATAAAPTSPEAKPPATVAPAVTKPAKPAPSKEVMQKYLQALTQGRAADGKGQLQEARRAFEEAVRLLPEGAAAQSELGWLAYRQQDLELAERATRTAISASSKPSLRAASLYNLGKILVARGKKPDAIAAFLASWDIGQSPAALTELRALDPQAAQTAWPRVTPFDGPLKLAEGGDQGPMIAACREQLFLAVSAQDPMEQMTNRAGIDALSVERLHCQKHASDPSGGAFPDVMVLSARFEENHYELNTIAVWVKTAEGWQYSVLDASENRKWKGDTSTVEKVAKIGSVLEIRKSVSRRDEVEVAIYSKGGRQGGQESPTSIVETDRTLYYVGFGPSRKPSLTAGIRASTSLSLERSGSVRSAEKSYPITLSPTGILQVGEPRITRNKLSENDFTGRELQVPVGSFPLKFP